MLHLDEHMYGEVTCKQTLIIVMEKYCGSSDLDVVRLHDVLDERRREVVELDDVVFSLVGAGWREETLGLLAVDGASGGVALLREELRETFVPLGRDARPIDSLRQNHQSVTC